MLDKKLHFATFRRPTILLAGMLLTAGLLLHVLRSLTVSLHDSEQREFAGETSVDGSVLGLADDPTVHLDLVPDRAPAASALMAAFAEDEPGQSAVSNMPPPPAKAPIAAGGGDVGGQAVVPAEFVVDSQLAEVLRVSAENPQPDDSPTELEEAEEEEGETFNGFGELFEHELRLLGGATGSSPVAPAGPEAVIAAAPQLIDGPPTAPNRPRTRPTPAPPLSSPPSLIAEPVAPAQSPPAEVAAPSQSPAVAGSESSGSDAPAARDRSAAVESAAGGATAKSSNPTPASSPTDAPPVEQTVDHLHGYVLGGLTHLLDTGFYAGYEVSVLSAMDNRDAGVGFADLTNDRSFGQDADGAVGAGQRVWIGMQGPGRGFRLSYWGLDSKTLVEGPYDTDIMPIAIRGNSSLEASAIDLEVTQPFGYHASRLLMSFGARYAEYEQVDTLVGFAEMGNGVRLTSLSNALREMDGMGFTASLEGTHPLHLPFWAGGCGHDHCNACGSWVEPGCYPTTGLFWYWNARGAALWGETKAAVLTEATAMIPGPNDATGFASSRDLAVLTNDNEAVLGNLELQLGMEYRRCLQILPTSLVLRGGLEYRRWDLGDDGVVSQSFASLQTEDLTQGGRATAYSQIMDEAIDLFGVAFSVGLYY